LNEAFIKLQWLGKELGAEEGEEEEEFHDAECFIQSKRKLEDTVSASFHPVYTAGLGI
jgi:hypothetical protein